MATRQTHWNECEWGVNECSWVCSRVSVRDIISVISARTFSHTFSHSQLRMPPAPCYPQCPWSKPSSTTSRLQPKFLRRSRGRRHIPPSPHNSKCVQVAEPVIKIPNTLTRTTIAATITTTTTKETTTIAEWLIEESQISNTINKPTRPVEGLSHAPAQLLLRSTGSCPK